MSNYAIDRDAVFAVLDDESHTRVRLTEYGTYGQALAAYTEMGAGLSPVLIYGYTTGNPVRARHLMVRSENDPQYNQTFLIRHVEVLSKESYATDIYAAKKALQPFGYVGRPGGWIYRNENAKRPIAQGWWAAAKMRGIHIRWEMVDGKMRHRFTVRRVHNALPTAPTTLPEN